MAPESYRSCCLHTSREYELVSTSPSTTLYFVHAVQKLTLKT